MKLCDEELKELNVIFRGVFNNAGFNGPPKDADDNTPIDPLAYVKFDNDTCLHILAWRRGKFGTELRAAELLLKAGVNVNAIGNRGDTPLHVANKIGCIDLANLLLRHGASKTIKNEIGMTPGDCTEARTLKLTEQELEELQVIFEDVENYGDFDAPIDPLTYLCPVGDTCLHKVAWRGGRWGTELRAAELLIKGGAEVNAIGDFGETPLHVAHRNGPNDLTKLLLANGASTTIRSEFGFLPCEYRSGPNAQMKKEFEAYKDAYEKPMDV